MYTISLNNSPKNPWFSQSTLTTLRAPRLVVKGNKHTCSVDINIHEISSPWCLQLNNLK